MHEPAGPERPDDEVAAAVVERFAGAVFDRSHGQPVVYVDRAVFADVAQFLRDEQQFTMCIDVTATDHLLDGERYAPDRRRGPSASKWSSTSCRTSGTGASA